MISAKVTRKEIHDAEKGIKKGIFDAVEKVAIAIEGQAVLFSPGPGNSQAKVKVPGEPTGELRQRITRTPASRSGGSVEASVGSPLDYALYQEEGTRRMRAANDGKGYFKPAVEKVRQKLTAIVGKAIRIGIRSS